MRSSANTDSLSSWLLGFVVTALGVAFVCSLLDRPGGHWLRDSAGLLLGQEARAAEEQDGSEQSNATPAAADKSADKSAEQFTPEQVQHFEEKIKPLLQEKCWKCHAAEKQRGGLRLDSRDGLLQGGDLGPAVNLESPAESQLLAAIRYDGLEMPPDGRLPDDQVAMLTDWVNSRLPWTPGDVAPPAVTAPEPSSPSTEPHWAYQPRVEQPAPAVQHPERARTTIDRWILAGLDQAGLEPNPEANRRTLIRRLYFDLLGLPPTVDEVTRFENDPSPLAYEELVDRLLASPQYGEKWGRHWLDLVRYAETNGYERDGPKQNVWRYRDYVIGALNQDKPYDRFVLEQLAGDELPDSDREAMIATGYYRLGIWDDEPVDADQAYYDSLDDVVSTTGLAFLGTTIGCARCHDHKIDPIPQKDYYRTLAFFHNILQDSVQHQFKKSAFSLNTQAVVATPEELAEHERRMREHEQRLSDLRAPLEVLEKTIFETLSNPEKEDARDANVRRQLIEKRAAKVLGEEDLKEYERLRAELRQLEETRVPPLPEALVVRENGRTPRATHVLVRGNAQAVGDAVEPGFLSIFASTPAPPRIEIREGVESSGNRLAFASWLVEPSHPLTARVIANRIWQHHFGRGLVASSSDYGLQGDRPTHPELLDHLAESLIQHGWSLKWLHRQILTSQAYRMSSADNMESLAKDPENLRLWRYNMRRLTAEELRDTVLSMTGELNLVMGGPSVFSVIPDEVLQTASRPDAAWGRSSPADQVRRSVYVHVKRSVADPVLKGFDAADTDGSCPVRFATTVPTQALTTLNGDFFLEQARVMAERLRREVGDDPAQQTKRALELALSRPATSEELERAARLLEGWQREDQLPADQALRYFCLMVLNLNETVYID